MNRRWLWNLPCDEVVRQVRERLVEAGLVTAISFDLRSALAGASDCPCPYHRTADCDCQMVVLLIYSTAEPPATLIAHGHDGYTWISLEQAAGTPNSPGIGAYIQTAVGVVPAIV